MDQQAATLLSTLKRPAAPSESKISLLNSLKSDIKHYRVPESAQATIFECLKLAITQQASSTLASTAFSTLGHLIKRLKIQDASGQAIIHLAPRLFPPLQDRLGDLREPVRNAASQALSDIFPFCGGDVEQIVRDEAIGGSNVRAKETGMRWVVRMHNDEGMPFKGYVPSMVARLEDADGNVRETAKTVLIELFSSAPDRAKTDLKKQLKAHSVRHMIASQIISQISEPSNSRPQTSGNLDADAELTGSTRSLPTLDHTAHFVETINSEAAQPPPVEVVPMDPIYVHSQRELDDFLRDMQPHFEGKETEQNWMPRDKSVTKLRRLLKGNAPTEYHHSFMAGIKSVADGIIKVSSSLRTTMSTNGCQLVQELARTLGPALDPHVEVFLQSFVKMSANTKHIAAENGKNTADAIFQSCSYNSRMIQQHIWGAMQEKNAQVRQTAPAWLRTILKRQSGYKSHFESSGGLASAEKCIKKGLNDANPKVKENMRATYWTFAKTWSDRAESIIAELDHKSRTALEKDPNNPNAALFASTSTLTVPSRSGGASSRSMLRELMAEQRKAKATGRVPERPNSAMATLSPSKSRTDSSSRSASRAPSHLRNETTRAPSAASNASGAEVQSSSAAKKGGALMSGPVRRPRRPEIQRPQTADPYASRRLLRPETPAEGSPVGSPQKGTGASKVSVPTSSAIRNRAKAPGIGNSSPIGSPGRRAPLFAHSHQSTDSRPTSKGSIATNGDEPSNLPEDDFTLVMPQGKPVVSTARGTFSPGHKRPGQTMSVDSGVPTLIGEEGMTMVLPELNHSQQRARSPLAYRSPMKAMFDDARERVGKLSPEAQRSMNRGDGRSDEKKADSNGISKPSPGAGEEVQIYEDPFVENARQATTLEDRRVLGELPVNENMRLSSPTHSVDSIHSPSSPRPTTEPRSPGASTSQDRTDVLRNRRLLMSGIERIRGQTLDAHGFRRVQELAKSRQDIWDGGKQYDELMSVLLTYLQTFDAEPLRPSSSSDGGPATAAAAAGTGNPSSKSAGLKAQALSVVRALLTLHRKRATPWHGPALAAVLACRRGVDANSHVLADMQRTADEVIAATPVPDACADAVMACVSQLRSEHGGGSTTTTATTTTAAATVAGAGAIAMALAVLRQLVATARARAFDLGLERRRALARVAAEHLNDAEPEVRKADVELASELFETFGTHDHQGEFWAEFRGVDEGRLGLLTYYIAKRGKAGGEGGGR